MTLIFGKNKLKNIMQAVTSNRINPRTTWDAS